MNDWRRLAVSVAVCGWLAASGAAGAQAPAELRKIISDHLLYPRDARYTMPAVLPSDGADAAKNGEWLTVAQRLGKAGLIRVGGASGKTLLDGTEQSLDVVVPSMNLRYETTALNVVLGRWDIEVARAAKEGEVTVVHGKRRLTRRTRAYGLVIEALAPKEAAKYSDQEVVWKISRNGASFDVVEKTQ